MKILPSTNEIRTTLNSFDFNIGKCTDYFLDNLGFEGVVIFKDKPWFHLGYHFHRVDDYLYVLEWEFISEIAGELKILHKWDFIIVPKWTIHDVRWSKEWAKYLVGTENGDFETIFVS